MADYPPVPPTSPAPPTPPPYPPYAPPPPPRRLMRSSRERMWAGVAGGMAEYFDLDPSLVRLLWVAATVVTGGLAVPVYILAWIILPRDDRSVGYGPGAWHDWSEEFHSETQRLAEEARRMADDVRAAGHSWRAPDAPPPPETGAASDKGATTTSTATPPTSAPAEDAWWRSDRYVEPHRGHHRHSKSTGVVLVALGVLFLAANAGIFRWIDGRTMWPLILIGIGVILLGRQSGWWSR
ncbi:MAG: PspC domain-containing protein [Chloroflexi bacterium]|nr:PspC domain-containing protein [Chloroflexota bacterium]MBV9134105.1 PspC domain-containing protein [Chloroflexota bacterium]